MFYRLLQFIYNSQNPKIGKTCIIPGMITPILLDVQIMYSFLNLYFLSDFNIEGNIKT